MCFTELLKKNQNKIFWTIGEFEFKYFGGSESYRLPFKNLFYFLNKRLRMI